MEASKTARRVPFLFVHRVVARNVLQKSQSGDLDLVRVGLWIEQCLELQGGDIERRWWTVAQILVTGHEAFVRTDLHLHFAPTPLTVTPFPTPRADVRRS